MLIAVPCLSLTFFLTSDKLSFQMKLTSWCVVLCRGDRWTIICSNITLFLDGTECFRRKRWRCLSVCLLQPISDGPGHPVCVWKYNFSFPYLFFKKKISGCCYLVCSDGVCQGNARDESPTTFFMLFLPWITEKGAVCLELGSQHMSNISTLNCIWTLLALDLFNKCLQPHLYNL